MRIDRTTVPGSGVLHHLVTRDGERFCLLVDGASNRHFFTYDGSDLDVWHTVLRVVFFPLSFALFAFGFLLILLRKDRRALHDLIGRAAVVYAWDARAARLRFLARSGTP